MSRNPTFPNPAVNNQTGLASIANYDYSSLLTRNQGLFKALQIASGGLTGGISASISGGKFWAGARQGVITAGLNHAMHWGGEKLFTKKTQTNAGTDPPGFFKRAWRWLFGKKNKAAGISTGPLEVEHNGQSISSDIPQMTETKINWWGRRSQGSFIESMFYDSANSFYALGQLTLTTRVANNGWDVIDNPVLNLDGTIANSREYAINIGGAGLSLVGGAGLNSKTAFKALGNGIKNYWPSLNKGPYLRIGISKANGLEGLKGTRKVFRVTWGNNTKHWFNYDLGKW